MGSRCSVGTCSVHARDQAAATAHGLCSFLVHAWLKRQASNLCLARMHPASAGRGSHGRLPIVHARIPVHMHAKPHGYLTSASLSALRRTGHGG